LVYSGADQPLGHIDVFTGQICASRAHSALAGGYASNGDGVGCFRRMGRLGGFSPPKLGPLGADCHINVPCNGGIVSANHPGL